MRILSRVILGSILSVAAPALALAGGAAPAPRAALPSPALHPAAPFSGARVLTLSGQRWGAGRGGARHQVEIVRPAGRRDYYPNAWLGTPLAYQQTAGESVQVRVETGSGEYLRPPAAIYAVPPPLAQGDHGYVAQPVIYNVAKVLHDHPLGRRRPLTRKY